MADGQDMYINLHNPDGVYCEENSETFCADGLKNNQGNPVDLSAWPGAIKLERDATKDPPEGFCVKAKDDGLSGKLEDEDCSAEKYAMCESSCGGEYTRFEVTKKGTLN